MTGSLCELILQHPSQFPRALLRHVLCACQCGVMFRLNHAVSWCVCFLFLRSRVRGGELSWLGFGLRFGRALGHGVRVGLG